MSWISKPQLVNLADEVARDQFILSDDIGRGRTYKRLQLGKIKIDTFSKEKTFSKLEELIKKGEGGNVFTPNVDHIMVAEENESFAKAYTRSVINLPDGMPIVWASKLFNEKIYSKLSGSDLLVPLIMWAWERDLSVFFLGSSTKVLKRAAQKFDDMCPRLRILGWASPEISNNPSYEEVENVMASIQPLNPDLIIVALGAPKQELFMDKAVNMCKSIMFGFGAAFDFYVGASKRAPKWMQVFGLEWFWRLIHEPKRLWKRYLRDLKFPFVVYREWKNQAKMKQIRQILNSRRRKLKA